MAAPESILWMTRDGEDKTKAPSRVKCLRLGFCWMLSIKMSIKSIVRVDILYKVGLGLSG